MALAGDAHIARRIETLSPKPPRRSGKGAECEISVTGFVLWGGARYFGRWPVAVSYILHDISALIMLGGIFIHIYLSTIGEPGTFQAMTRGAVSEPWAWTFHPAWYKEVTGRDPVEAYEEARRRTQP